VSQKDNEKEFTCPEGKLLTEIPGLHCNFESHWPSYYYGA